MVEVQLPVADNKVPEFECGYSPTCSRCYPLDEFVECCERQAKAMTLIEEESGSVIDSHIGGLIASIMSDVSMKKHISAEQLRMYMDCFSYILLADGFSIDEILKMRPNISQTIRDLYPSIIKD